MIKLSLPKKRLSILKQPLTLALGCSMITGIALGLYRPNHSAESSLTSTINETLINRLNELQSHVISLELATQKPLPEIDLSVLEQKLKELSQEVAGLSQFNPLDLNKRLEHRLNQTEQSLSQQLNTLNQTVTNMTSANHLITYLPLEALPFSVASIDSIQNTPVASLHYDYKTVPVEKGDLLAGWKVVLVDFQRQRIEFENTHQERVLIKQDHIG